MLIGIIEVIDARVGALAGRRAGRGGIVFRKHRDPHDHHADVGAVPPLKNGLPDRTGAGETLRSRGRHKGDHADRAVLLVEANGQGV